LNRQTIPYRHGVARHWVLVGLMGSGKTTVGAELARRARRVFVDNDVQLASASGRTAREIENDVGFDALHELERDALVEALGASRPAVIAAAASVVDDANLRARLQRDADVIWLETDVDDLVRRVINQPHRPLAPDIAAQLRDQAASRSARFREIADVVVDGGRAPAVIVDDLLSKLGAL
jgi:shikimate kinase